MLDSGTVAWPEDLTAAVAWTDFHQNPPGLLGIWRAFLPAMTEVSEVLLWNHFCQTLGMGKLDSEICMLAGVEEQHSKYYVWYKKDTSFNLGYNNNFAFGVPLTGLSKGNIFGAMHKEGHDIPNKN